METTRKARFEEVAEALGESPDRVKLIDMAKWTRTIASLTKEGALVALHVRRWRGQSKLTLDAMGIYPKTAEERAMYERLMSLGQRYLLPKRVLDRVQSIEERGRTALWQCSLHTFWGRFIPRTRYSEWSERNAEVKAAYEAYIEEMANDWPNLLVEVRREYLALARANYRRLLAAGAPDLGDEEAWVGKFVSNVMAQIPSAERFRATASYTWDSEYLPLRESQEKVLGMDGEGVKEVRDALEADIRATEARKAAEDLSRFVADIQADIRERVYNASVSVLEAMRKNEKLPGNSTKQLKNLVETVNSLKFWEDSELEGKLAEIARLVDVPAEERDMKALKKVIRKVGAESRMILLELDRPPTRSVKDAGIPDDIDALDTVIRGRRKGRTADLGDVAVQLDVEAPRTARHAKKEEVAAL
jgi:hypothetical protein